MQKYAHDPGGGGVAKTEADVVFANFVGKPYIGRHDAKPVTSGCGIASPITNVSRAPCEIEGDVI